MSDLYDKKVFQFKVYFDSYRTSTAMSKLLYILDSRHSVKRSIIIQFSKTGSKVQRLVNKDFPFSAKAQEDCREETY